MALTDKQREKLKGQFFQNKKGSNTGGDRMSRLEKVAGINKIKTEEPQKQRFSEKHPILGGIFDIFRRSGTTAAKVGSTIGTAAARSEFGEKVREKNQIVIDALIKRGIDVPEINKQNVEAFKKGLYSPTVFTSTGRDLSPFKTGKEAAGEVLLSASDILTPFLGGGNLPIKIAVGSMLGMTHGAGEKLRENADAKEVGIHSLAGGLFGSLIPVIGNKIFKPLWDVTTKKLPTKLYGQIFKMAKDDLKLYWQSLAKNKTQAYNPTLAEEMLERELRGSSKNMFIYSYNKLGELEQAVQKKVGSNIKNIIPIKNKSGYIDILQTLKDKFKVGFLSKRAKNAESLIASLRKTKGNNINMGTALKLRRFIDNMRQSKSFKLDPTLVPREEEYKMAADSLRTALSKAGLGDLMNEERIFIEGMDSIIDDAVRRQNLKLLGLTDILIGGGGLASGFPGAGIGAAAAVRGFQQPFTLTGIGQMLYKLGRSTKTPQAEFAKPLVSATTRNVFDTILGKSRQ